MSLAEKISELLTTTPGSYHPDDEDVAKVVEKDAADSEEDEIETSKFRKRNVDLLEDVDVKYSGRKSSRKDFIDEDDDDVDNVSNENYEITSEEDYSDVGTESDAETDDADGPLLTREEKHDIIHVTDPNVLNEVRKGTNVRNQLSIWENLLEIRIQLQKCLSTANKFPQAATFKDIKIQSGEAFSSKVAETRKNVAIALDKLLHLQEVLSKQSPETKVHDDEEIPSESDGEVDEKEENDDEEKERPKKRRKLEMHYESTIADSHEKYRTYRNSVIQKWYDKTRIGLASVKTGAVHSVLDQIEYHLSEMKEKLQKRTRVKRSDYEVLGKTRGDDDEEDPEIFDDSDFYHELLRELIEFKSADITDPVQLGRQWIRLQNLRSKMKRKIDTRATKGRKVRYTVHAKLINFMAPVDEGGGWTDEAKTELFGSLFGKNQTVAQVF